MRSNGVEEKYITGDASDREKFQKWAETLERGIGEIRCITGAILELQKIFWILWCTEWKNSRGGMESLQ